MQNVEKPFLFAGNRHWNVDKSICVFWVAPLKIKLD